MKYYCSLLLVLLFCPTLANAQASDHVWLETSKLKVRINADGRLFCDDEKGAFLVPNGDSMSVLARGSALWFSGLDLGNNMVLSEQQYMPQSGHFIPGLRGVPNSGKVWKVTQMDVLEHLADWTDNWVIDNPNPALFSWPSSANPFSMDYNGFEAPFDPFSPIGPSNESGVYEPHKGDYPALFMADYFAPTWHLPSEMAVFRYFAEPTSTDKWLFPLQIWGVAFVYDCPENDLLSQSVFVRYWWTPEVDDERLIDTSTVSVLCDFDIGDPNNDYHGYLPHRMTYFSYNADSTDVVWGDKSPIAFLSTLILPAGITRWRNPDGTVDHSSRYTNPKMMPLGFSGVGPPGIWAPEDKEEYYNYMTGTWRDGSPLTWGGSGYSPGTPGAPLAESAFPGYPDSLGQWSEMSAQTKPGNRRALLNNYMNFSLPGTRNNMLLRYSYMPWQPGSLTDRILDWEKEHKFLYQLMYWHCFEDTPEVGCEFTLPQRPDKPDKLTVFPNPASNYVKVWHEGSDLNKMLLFDINGRLVNVGQHHHDYSEISIAHLPAGTYMLQCETRTGERKMAKVIIAH